MSQDKLARQLSATRRQRYEVRSSSQTNPFSPPNGAIPLIDALRDDLAASTDAIHGHLLDRRFATGLGLIGVRGVGKTTTLATFQRDCSADNFLVIRMNISHNNSFILDLSSRIRQATERHNDLPNMNRQVSQLSRSVRIKGKAKIPFIPIELDFETAASTSDKALGQLEKLMDGLLKHVVKHRTPTVFLLDEADFLHDSDFEDAFASLIGTAAQRDLPITLLAAGSGAEVLRGLRGRSTFVADLTKACWLRRLKDSEALQLFLDTSAAGGQDWTGLDFARTLAICQGIPRRIQAMGRDIFEKANTQGPLNAIGGAVEEMQHRLDGMTQSLGRSEQRVLWAVKELSGGEAIGYGDCVESLGKLLGDNWSHDAIWESLDR